MPSTPREVFELFTNDREEGDIIPYLAYAIFAAERYEWMYRELDRHGEFPDVDTESRWIQEKPDQYFARLEARATQWLDTFSRDYLDENIEQEKQEAVEQSVKTSIDELRATLSHRLVNLERFWPAFLNNIAGGFVATILFTGFLFVVAVAVFGDLSAVDLAKETAD